MLDADTISRRLKAARWLAGSSRNGRGQLVPLSAAELAQDPGLTRNRITASRIEEIEQERVQAREMELEKIADALGVPQWWFTAEELPQAATTDSIGDHVDAVIERRFEQLVGLLRGAGVLKGPDLAADREEWDAAVREAAEAAERIAQQDAAADAASRSHQQEGPRRSERP